MKDISVSNARKDIYNLVDKVNEEAGEYKIIGKRNSAVLVAESDWEAIKETLYLYETGNAKDIIEGMNTSIEDCEVIDWKNTK